MQFLSSAFYKLMSIIMALLVSLGAIASPSAEAPLNMSEADTELCFVAFGDTQVSNYNFTREEYLIPVAEDIENAQCFIDAFVIAGDIAENGLASEYDRVYTDICNTGCGKYIFASGNHDIRLRDINQATDRFYGLMNKLNAPEDAVSGNYYAMAVNGYRFIVLGSEKGSFEDAYISSEQLGFLSHELNLAESEGKPAFVISHYPLKNTHGLPDTWSNSLWESGSIGDQSDALFEVMNAHKNVFYITGHLHTGFGQYTFEQLDNVYSINLPSVGIENKDGDYNNQGIGFFVEVTPTKVLFRARNFASGEYLPEYDIEVAL